jgi:hypothetical protein
VGDFRVLFDVAEDTGYRAHLADVGGNALGVEVPFTPFLSKEDYEGLRWYQARSLVTVAGGSSG